jgi:hypothetical protein
MAQKRVDFVITEKGAARAKQGFNSVDNSIKSAAKSAAMYAAAYIGVRGIISITKQAIEAFGIQEQAEKRLSVATGRNTDALLKQASALQQVTTFGDEMIIGVQASLAAFADSDAEIKKLTVATLDLAAATGMDLKAAGDLIAKSYGSSTNALSRYGIEVTGVANSTERLDTLTGNIAARFSGQAAAAGETMAGSMQQARNAVGDLAEVIGAALSDSVIELAGDLKSASEDVIAFFEIFNEQKTQTRVKELGEEILRLNDIYKALGDNDVWDGGIKEGIWDKLVAATREYKELTGQILPETELWANSLRNVEEAGVGVVALKDALPDMVNDFGNLVNVSSMLAQSLENAFDPDMSKGDAFKQFTISFLSLLEGVVLASEAVSTALTFTFLGPAGIIAAISAIAALEGAKSLVRNAKFAATGADFVTDGPQLMVVGEAGREKVQVTPLEGPNIDGPQGGMTFIFNGNITDKEYVRSFLIPEITRASRLGYA